jgi:hypothetical protein
MVLSFVHETVLGVSIVSSVHRVIFSYNVLLRTVRVVAVITPLEGIFDERA